MPLVTSPDGQVFDSDDFGSCKIEEFFGGHWYVYIELKSAKRLTISADSEEDAQKKAKQIRDRITRARGSRSSVKQLEQGGRKVAVTGITIFIGHGNSPIWRELSDFLEKRLHLSVEEFNSVSVAGVPTVTRLEEMLNAAAFAFLVMTAEDEGPDGKRNPRLNVVHEAGLFQGKLGFQKAIILLEDGCEEFSNIHGLSQIRFPKGNIEASYEKIRAVLERERLAPSEPPGGKLPEYKSRIPYTHSRKPKE